MKDIFKNSLSREEMKITFAGGMDESCPMPGSICNVNISSCGSLVCVVVSGSWGTCEIQ